MTVRPRLFLATSAAAVLAVGVAAASAGDVTITPGVGIGNVRLGMTRAQVERVLGRDWTLNAREGAYTELVWNYGSFGVGFVRGRAVEVSTSLRNDRTRKGIGVGSTWLQLMRAHPGGQCAVNAPSNARPWFEYLQTNQGGTQTLWVFKPWYNRRTPLVRLVFVRTAFRPLPPHFTPEPGVLRCVGNWQNERSPRVSTR